MLTLDLDVAADSGMNDNEIRAIISRAGGHVDSYDPIGPGGGNPNYVVSVPDRKTGSAVIRALYGENTESTTEPLDTYIIHQSVYVFTEYRKSDGNVLNAVFSNRQTALTALAALNDNIADYGVSFAELESALAGGGFENDDFILTLNVVNFNDAPW